MLRMTNLSKVYRTHMIETHALRGFEIEVREGEFVTVTGPSGSGKTSFLNIAGLLEEFSSGEYVLDGVNVKGLDDNARSKLRNEKLGFIFQGFNLIPDLNLFDNVDVPLRYRGFNASERKRRIEDALSKVGLASRMKHYPAELSGGQQQRAAIARALITCPDVIFADEPTGALDPHTAAGVLGLLREAADGTTVVIVTHDPQVTRFCDQAVFLYGGRVDRVLPYPEPAMVARLVAELGERAEQASLAGGRFDGGRG